MGSSFYILHIDGVGEYVMHHEDCTRCMFVFTSKKTISDFIELMEMPEHKEFSAVPFDTDSLADFLVNIRPPIHAVATDPLAECEFVPVVELDDFLNTIRGE